MGRDSGLFPLVHGADMKRNFPEERAGRGFLNQLSSLGNQLKASAFLIASILMNAMTALPVTGTMNPDSGQCHMPATGQTANNQIQQGMNVPFLCHEQQGFLEGVELRDIIFFQGHGA
jgi:hypothetical protein